MRTRSFKLEKLVRDKIVESTEEAGGFVDYEKLEGEALKDALIVKMKEEMEELLQSEKPDIEELADLRETIDAIGVLMGFSKVEVDAAQYDKRRKLGGFTSGIWAKIAKVPIGSAQENYYASDPSRFPEVKGEGK